MSFRSYEELIKKVQKNKELKRVALVAATDEHAIQAVFDAQDKRIVYPILIGQHNAVASLINKMKYNAKDYLIVNVEKDEDPANVAVQLVRSGQADFLMKGKIDTANLLKSVVAKENGLRTGEVMSHIALLEIPNYHKLLAVTDAGMITYPNLEQKKQIIVNTVRVLTGMGYENPKVAVLCAVEQVNDKMQETLDAVKLKRMNEEGIITGCEIEGPISFDLAFSKEAAEIKGYQSSNCGDFDVLLVPNIVTGNSLAKALIHFAGAKMAGMVLGAKVPIVLTSRSSSVEEKYLSLVLSAVAS